MGASTILELDQIRVEYITYGTLIEKVGLKKIEDRFEKIEASFSKFISGCEIQGKFELNRRILLIAILDFFSDVLRLQEFHNIKEINEIKMKAYEAAWILRRKPIQAIKAYDSPENDYINEQAVYDYLTAYLMDGKLIDDKSIYNEMKGFFDSLYYYLRFRDCEPRALELVLLAFKVGEVFGKKSESK